MRPVLFYAIFYPHVYVSFGDNLGYLHCRVYRASSAAGAVTVSVALCDSELHPSEASFYDQSKNQRRRNAIVCKERMTASATMA